MLLKASLSALTVLQLLPAAAGQQERFRQRQSTGCNVNTVRNRVEDVNRACCTSGVDCSGAAPSHCSTECAEIFRPFAEDCRAVLELFDSSELGGLDGSALELFLGTCEAANSCPMGYLEDTTAMVGVCSGHGFCDGPGLRAQTEVPSQMPWLDFVVNKNVKQALAMATGGRMEFANGESECVCDVGYSGDACETLWMPNVPDPCIPEELLLSGTCDLRSGTDPEPGTFVLAGHYHNDRPYWKGGSGLILYYVPAGVIAPRVGASWVVDTELTPLEFVGFMPAQPGQLPQFGLKEWFWVGCGPHELKNINLSPVAQGYEAPSKLQIRPVADHAGCEPYADIYALDGYKNNHPLYKSTTLHPQRSLYYDTQELRLHHFSAEVDSAGRPKTHETTFRWYIDTDESNDSGTRAQPDDDHTVNGRHSLDAGAAQEDVPFSAEIGMFTNYGNLPPLGVYSNWNALCGVEYVSVGIQMEPEKACQSNPCVNGGRCTSHGPHYQTWFTCTCASGYAGETCEQQMDTNDFWGSLITCGEDIVDDVDPATNEPLGYMGGGGH